MKFILTFGNYFFRFPRDNFWSRTIVKDYEFSKFINGKTDFKTTELNLLFDNTRPFSVHKKIDGTVLADKMNSLTPDEIKTVTYDIAKFMYQLHTIQFTPNEIFETNNIGLNLIDFLNELLTFHVEKKDITFWNYENLIKKDHSILVHGDLNSSNIILDDSCHISAIIDFGFGGFGNSYFDIARIIGRCPKSFKSEIIHSYKTLAHNTLNYCELENTINMWNNIDNAYINYMKKIGIYQ